MLTSLKGDDTDQVFEEFKEGQMEDLGLTQLHNLEFKVENLQQAIFDLTTRFDRLEQLFSDAETMKNTKAELKNNSKKHVTPRKLSLSSESSDSNSEHEPTPKGILSYLFALYLVIAKQAPKKAPNKRKLADLNQSRLPLENRPETTQKKGKTIPQRYFNVSDYSQGKPENRYCKF